MRYEPTFQRTVAALNLIKALALRYGNFIFAR